MTEKLKEADYWSEDNRVERIKIGTKIKAQEETPLLPKSSQSVTRRSYVAHLIIIFVIIFIGLTFFLIAIQALQLSSKGLATGLIAEKDSVLLGVYQVPQHEKASLSITEIVETEDAYHENYYAIVPSSKVVIHTEFSTENNSIVLLADNSFAINQRYIYGLKDSIIKYNICLGNGARPSVSTLYGFASEEAYNKYVQSVSVESVFTKDFLVGGHGKIICGNFSFSFNKAGYYFFVLKARYANTYANYTVVADLKRLSINDYLRNYSACRVDQQKRSCSLDFDSPSGEWSLIGYSTKKYGFYSHINHVHMNISKERKPPWNTMYGILFYGGLGIVGSGFLYLTVIIVTKFLLFSSSRKKAYTVLY